MSLSNIATLLPISQQGQSSPLQGAPTTGHGHHGAQPSSSNTFDSFLAALSGVTDSDGEDSSSSQTTSAQPPKAPTTPAATNNHAIGANLDIHV